MFVTYFSTCLYLFAGVTFAAKGYFDALVRMGELASESQGSKDLGEFRHAALASREQAKTVWLDPT